MSQGAVAPDSVPTAAAAAADEAALADAVAAAVTTSAADAAATATSPLLRVRAAQPSPEGFTCAPGSHSKQRELRGGDQRSGGHVEQEDAPSTAENEPIGHAMGADSPDALQNEPIGHAMGADSPDALQNDPAGHRSQEVRLMNEPCEHSWQLREPGDEKVPG
jgi:hypothetical protein